MNLSTILYLDPKLTNEEESLLKKYALLNKKKVLILEYEKSKILINDIETPTQSIEKAKEVAQKLVKSGVIDLKLKVSKENQGFKRSKHLERKIKESEQSQSQLQNDSDPISTPKSQLFQKRSNANYNKPCVNQDFDYVENDGSNIVPSPFHAPPPSTVIPRKNTAANVPLNITTQLQNQIKDPSTYIPKRRTSYLNPPNNTLYISTMVLNRSGPTGTLTEPLINSVFSQHKFSKCNFQGRHNRAFLSFESIQVAEDIIKKLHNTVVKNEETGEDVHLIVSYARHNASNVNTKNSASVNNAISYPDNKKISTDHRNVPSSLSQTPSQSELDASMPIPSKQKFKRISNPWGASTFSGNLNSNLPKNDMALTHNSRDLDNDNNNGRDKIPASFYDDRAKNIPKTPENVSSIDQNSNNNVQQDDVIEENPFRNLIQYEEIDF
ncbi:unnamed protein product [Gordionus sp. m RMFG-2023]|uniref:uncharacterized protein DDB_G0286175-like n=1 Tax=Gordionus sp. m RMFG-2023 TaxID=3053472 RepID=UPI0030DE3B74